MFDEVRIVWLGELCSQSEPKVGTLCNDVPACPFPSSASGIRILGVPVEYYET
jgi:hypothetical protein